MSDNRPVYDDGIRRRLVAITTALLIAAPTDNTDPPYFSSQKNLHRFRSSQMCRKSS